MNTSGPPPWDAAAFATDPSPRRKYLLLRVGGSPVPPSPALSRDEESYDLVASWILSDASPWGEDLKNDVQELLKEFLDKSRGRLSDREAWQLGGLLCLASRIRDVECGETVLNFMMGTGGHGLSSQFLEVAELDGLYDRVGRLMFRLLDLTDVAGAVNLFEAGVRLAQNPRDAAECFTFLARRDRARAETMLVHVVNLCHKSNDSDTLDFVIRIAAEALWAGDVQQTAKALRDMFIAKDTALRMFLAAHLDNMWDDYMVHLKSRELQHGTTIDSPNLIEREEAGLASSWLSAVA